MEYVVRYDALSTRSTWCWDFITYVESEWHDAYAVLDKQLSTRCETTRLMTSLARHVLSWQLEEGNRWSKTCFVIVLQAIVFKPD